MRLSNETLIQNEFIQRNFIEFNLVTLMKSVYKRISVLGFDFSASLHAFFLQIS